PARVRDWVFTVSLQLLAGDAAAAEKTCAAMQKNHANVALSPDDANHLLRIVLLAKAVDARDVLKQANAFPNSAASWHTRALANFAAGEYGTAIAQAERSLEQNSSRGLVGVNYA